MSNSSWVVGRYTGARAKSVAAHAEAGIGYIMLENQGTSNNPDILVAFQSTSNPLPEHLTPVTDPIKIMKYEKIRHQRMGLDGRHNA